MPSAVVALTALLAAWAGFARPAVGQGRVQVRKDVVIDRKDGRTEVKKEEVIDRRGPGGRVEVQKKEVIDRQGRNGKIEVEKKETIDRRSRWWRWAPRGRVSLQRLGQPVRPLLRLGQAEGALAAQRQAAPVARTA